MNKLKRFIKKYTKYIVLTLLLCILPSNFGKASSSIVSDTVKNSHKFNPKTFVIKGDSLMCLTKKEAYIAGKHLQTIPIYKSIVKDQDTIIRTQAANLEKKDSIIVLKDNYANTIDSLYEDKDNKYQALESKYKTTKKNSFIKSLAILSIVIIAVMYH